jgi:hypothetical protein
MPPTIPANSPENKGALDANATPKHSGNATKNTTIPEIMSKENGDGLFRKKSTMPFRSKQAKQRRAQQNTSNHFANNLRLAKKFHSPAYHPASHEDDKKL